MCKMLMSLESGSEVETLQKDVAHVCEAMLAFPLRLPGTRFYKGLEVITLFHLNKRPFRTCMHACPSFIFNNEH